MRRMRCTRKRICSVALDCSSGGLRAVSEKSLRSHAEVGIRPLPLKQVFRLNCRWPGRPRLDSSRASSRTLTRSLQRSITSGAKILKYNRISGSEYRSCSLSEQDILCSVPVGPCMVAEHTAHAGLSEGKQWETDMEKIAYRYGMDSRAPSTTSRRKSTCMCSARRRKEEQCVDPE